MDTGSREKIPALPSASVYHRFFIESAKAFVNLKNELGPERLALLLKVNRIDLDHIRVGEKLVIPDDLSDPMRLAPFPREIQRLRAIPKFVLVSQQVQAFGAYQDGWLTRWGPTSTGKRSTPTPAGLFFMNWKSKQTVSTEDSSWVLKWYVNIDNRRGVSFHQYELPGYPASHACVRLQEDDARWLYEWSIQWLITSNGREVLANGTAVVVLGEYPWGQPAPWKQLPEDPRATQVSEAEVDEVLAGYLATIYERQQEWDDYLPRPAADSALGNGFVSPP